MLQSQDIFKKIRINIIGYGGSEGMVVSYNDVPQNSGLKSGGSDMGAQRKKYLVY
jgi:hypothetical protein